MPRIIFYYNHYNTLGHSTRVFSLVKGFRRSWGERAELAVLQGGKKQRLMPFEQYARVSLLPYAMDRRGMLIEEQKEFYGHMISHARMGSMLKRRLDVIQRVVDEFKPDLFITEYFPFGKEFWTFEVPYVLEYLRKHTSCAIAASTGYLNAIEDTYRYIKEFYDILFVHSPEEFSREYPRYLHPDGVRQLRRVLKEFPDKVHFTGFVFDAPDLSGWEGIRRKYLGKRYRRLVLVSRGGGIVNKKILLASLMASRKRPDDFFIVCCGPATGEDEFREYTALCRNLPNVALKRAINPEEFCAYLKASDASISMAGYNTSAKLLYLGTRSILVPYATYEQQWRADLCGRYLPVRVIEESKLTASLVSRSLDELFQEPAAAPAVPRSWFSGTENTIDELRCLLR